jgi:hypothetical protein
MTIPAPVGGLNAVDEFEDMDPRDALILDNVFPDVYNVKLRRGFSSHVTGMPSTVESLMTYSSPTTTKLFAASGGSIYDVTTAGSVGSAAVTSLNSNRWQWTNFATSGGNFLVICNGLDSVRNYNGSVWSTPTISSVTSSTLISVIPHKSRLWFVQKNTSDAWYLPVSSIAGTAVKFPVGPFFRLGGKLQALGTLSHDGGNGPDDYLCFISSRGEVLVYQGTDPSSSSTWALKGHYFTGYPVGDRSTVQLGGDCIIITSDGAISVSAMLGVDRSQDQKASVSYKIQTLFNQAVQNYSANFGWQSIIYPKGNWALFNVPITSTRYEQYVMNTVTGAWCHFTGMNGLCWGLLNENIYFGGTGGKVYRADNGYQDNGSPIYGEIKTAWNYLKSRGVNKRITMVRPVMQSNGSPSILMSINVDYADTPPTGAVVIGSSSDTLWGTAKWGSGKWAGLTNITTQWFTSGAIGYAVALHLKIAADGQQLSINSFDIQAEAGGPL